MITRKKLAQLGMITYSISIFLMIFLSFIVFILIPSVGDWEFFSYHVYGSLIVYGVAMLPYLIFALLISLSRLKSLFVLLILILSMEIAALIIAEQSIVVTIFTTEFTLESSALIGYPIVLIISFFTVKKMLKIDFSTPI